MSVVAFRTETGLRFFDITDDENVKQMHDSLVELKAQQRPDAEYVFCITITDDDRSIEMRCKDIWVEARVVRSVGF